MCVELKGGVKGWSEPSVVLAPVSLMLSNCARGTLNGVADTWYRTHATYPGVNVVGNHSGLFLTFYMPTAHTHYEGSLYGIGKPCSLHWAHDL